MTATFFLAMIGLVIFRSESIGQAVGYCGQMFTTSLFHVGGLDCIPALIWCLLMMAVEWVQRNKQHALMISGIKNGWLRWLIYTVVAFLIFCLIPNQMNQFIYFQF